MIKNVLFFVIGLVIAGFSIWKLVNNSSNPEDFSEITKIALRDVGNQLLLSNGDSTSVVLPILEEGALKYKLSFEADLAIVPDTLVARVKYSINKANLPRYYRVEVKRCEDGEVAYSYEMRDTKENGIVPCGGRLIKDGCYNIYFRFIDKESVPFQDHLRYYLMLFAGLSIGIAGFLKLKNNRTHSRNPDSDNNHISLGSFNFYPEQNKLVKHPETINLSKKECEILALLVERPNQIIKRDELTKAVWEDNGVFVGRSLDTYISKLRKKLQADHSVKLTNVHGVGYKLEIETN